MQKPTIAIIGPGRAGSALGRALHKAGYTIAAIAGRNPDNVRNLAAELGAVQAQGQLHECPFSECEGIC